MSHNAKSARLPSLSTLAGVTVLAVAALILSGCEVTEASGNNYRPGPMCPAIYDPVCAESRGEARTFPNSCEARAQNWRVVSSGQCRPGDFRDDRRDDRNRDFRNRDGRDRDFRGRDDRNRDFRGRDNRVPDFRDNSRDRNDRRDFERPRFDNQPGRDPVVRPVRPDRPQPPVYQPPVRPVQPVRPQPPVIPNPPVQPVAPGDACPQVFQQVCGQLGDKAQMFMNQCELRRAGATEVAAGQCMGGNR